MIRVQFQTIWVRTKPCYKQWKFFLDFLGVSRRFRINRLPLSDSGQYFKHFGEKKFEIRVRSGGWQFYQFLSKNYDLVKKTWQNLLSCFFLQYWILLMIFIVKRWFNFIGVCWTTIQRELSRCHHIMWRTVHQGT